MPLQRIDFLDIFAPDLKEQNLSGQYSVRDDANSRVFAVKNPNGYPNDVLNYARMEGDDDEYVYDQFTEGDPPDGWKDPGVIKMHNANNNRGTKIMKRWINYPFTAPIEVTDAYSPFMKLNHGVYDSKLHTVLATKRVLHPPVAEVWPGSVGNIPTWLLEYFYNGKLVPGTLGIQYPSLETYKCGYDPATKRAFGLLQWTLFSRGGDGKYTQQDQSKPAIQLRSFKGKTEDGHNDQNSRLVRIPFLGIDGVLPR